jgi:hypothetical protein
MPKLDVLYLHACLMATIESGYELRDKADFYVASESIGWGPIDPAMFVIGVADNPQIPAITATTSGEQLARAMAVSYATGLARSPNYPSTISVTRLSQASNVAQKASNLAASIRQSSNRRTILNSVREDVQHFEETGDGRITTADKLADLRHFAQLVAEQADDNAIDTAASELMTVLDQYVVFRDQWSGNEPDHGYEWNHDNSHGVSIFFPPPYRRPTYYSGDWLDFAAGTNWWGHGLPALAAAEPSADTIEWGQMLADWVMETDPSAQEDPDPPALVELGSTQEHTYLPLIIR